ncbi:MAG: DsbC family protein [Desulfuromonas sp.]|nr:DsbC family protein [Desulfuromonas sp.]
MVRYAVLVLCLCLLPLSAWAFGDAGCGAGECRDCHSLTSEEAIKLLPPGADRITSVKFSDVGGLWEVKGQAKGRMFTVYVDFSKRYMIAGKVLRLRDGVDISHTVDVKELGRQGTLVLGNEQAAVKVFVFTDPKCGHCRKLHQELHKVVAANPNIVFYIKLMSMFTDKKIVNDIICSGSLQVLEDAMADKPVPASNCDSSVVDETMAFAKRWQIHSTPTLVLPDGKVLSGGRPAEVLLKELEPFMPTAN